jgi:hypothetical protein
MYSENTFTTELRKIVTYKEELLTDVKNMLYRRTDDVEKLQKVVADTEGQFANCLQQTKALGEEKERRQKELEDLRRAAQKLVDMVKRANLAGATSWSTAEGRQFPHRSPGCLC